jgi:3-isopropylmalate dehydrogenase
MANPSAAIMCAVMLLRYFGEQPAAEKVEKALEECLDLGLTTPDLGGTLSTMGMAQEVVGRMG